MISESKYKNTGLNKAIKYQCKYFTEDKKDLLNPL